MKYTEFYKLSTGYKAGSIPPIFDVKYIKPIPAVGSDSIMYHDGRYCIETIINKSYERLAKLGKHYIGFKIIESNSILNKGRTLYSNINPMI
jgi:hypothetical protein